MSSLHPPTRCVWCGAHAAKVDLRLVLFKLTDVRAMRCADTLACIRRQYRRKLRRDLGEWAA